MYDRIILETVEYHQSMLADEACMRGYLRAILKVVEPCDVVLDIGSGTGILAYFAVIVIATVAALPAPFMIAIIVLLVTGIPTTEAIPIILADLVAHAITFSLGLLPRPQTAPPAAKQQAIENSGGTTPEGSDA